jgi:lipopolysaccharide transport system ATP-binding protein
MSDTVIRATGISKKFCRSLRRAVSYGLIDIGRNAIGLSARSDRLRSREFWAVDDVSFELRRGEVLGIVGVNGSGKSTILKMLNGLIMPDRGRIEVNGRVSALIEVGAGFHPMLTGRENIYINGAILGMRRREIDRRFDSIVEFSGVGDAIDTPLKFYSSGMYVRLGFAVAAHLETDALLVDEVLAVGDAEFRTRCYRKIADLLREGVAIAFVSHNLVDLQRLCTRSFWLDEGRIEHEGDTMGVLGGYTEHVDHMTLQESPFAHHELPEEQREGGRLTGVSFVNGEGTESDTFCSGECFRVVLGFETDHPDEALTFTFSFRSGDGSVYSAYCSAYDRFSLIPGRRRGAVELRIPELLLAPGVYSTSVGLWDGEYLAAFDWHWDVKTFRVTSRKPMPGRFELPHTWATIEDDSRGGARE